MPATKSALQASQSAAPATKSALRNLHFEVTKYTAPATISENEPRVEKSPFTAPVHVQKMLRLTRDLHFEGKPLSDPCHKVDFGPPKHDVSLAPATKSDHHVRKCARRHNESAVATSTHRGPPDFASLPIEIYK